MVGGFNSRIVCGKLERTLPGAVRRRSRVIASLGRIDTGLPVPSCRDTTKRKEPADGPTKSEDAIGAKGRPFTGAEYSRACATGAVYVTASAS